MAHRSGCDCDGCWARGAAMALFGIAPAPHTTPERAAAVGLFVGCLAVIGGAVLTIFGVRL